MVDFVSVVSAIFFSSSSPIPALRFLTVFALTLTEDCHPVTRCMW